MLRVVQRSQADEDSIVAPGSDGEVEQKVREIAGDGFGIWSLRDLLSKDATSRHLLGMQEDDVVTRVAGGVKEGKYVFVRRGGVRTTLPSPLPPPVAAPPPKKEAPKKVTEKKPWKLDVTVFTNSKAPWPKGTVTVSVRGAQGGEQTTKMTSNRAAALSFTGNHDSPHEYEVKASAPGWDAVASVKVQLKNEDAKTCEVELAPPKVHLRLSYQAPDDAVRPFPKDFALKVAWDGGPTKDAKVEDEKGYVAFDMEKGKAKFTLKFDHAKTRYLVHEKASGGGAGKPTVEEDPDDDALRTRTTDGKLFFALPRAWSLVHAKWDAAGVTVPQDGQIALPDEGIGTKDAPGHLTLVPKCQYVRFEFHDRKHWKDHAVGTDKKRVSIPPVVLKGARKSDAAGAPTAPVAGSHDAVSNWVVETDDAAKTCQALPWVVTRKDDGTDLAKLDKEMLLEWGWEKGFVHSKSKTERVVVKLEPADDKRKPSKDRSQYYDLPKAWKSKCWWTRTSDATKNGFFDELTPEVIELSLTKATPMTFSLDDVVLVDAAGTSQEVRDKDKDDAAKDLSKHSRVALLHLDPEDSHKVKVHGPRALAAYHSKSEFAKEAGSETRRNVITDYPFNLRAVVFCNGFHDVHDKRTETADFAKKQVLGARAAKLDDADLSAKKAVSGFVAGDYGAAYAVKDAGNFDLHYLHYGATDGTKVYGALVTFWSTRFFTADADVPPPRTAAKIFYDTATPPVAHRGDVGDKRNYVTKGMGNSMTRWNEKDYQLEESDGKTDVVVKTFALFEAKEIEDPANTWTTLGGKAHCQSALVKNKLGSWMGETVARLRESGYANEGEGWGDPPNNLPAHVDHGTVVAPAKLALAHELGHASGLDDDYVYYTGEVPALVRYEQYFPGMPYVIDQGSLMNSNRAIRLRQYWGRVNWVNDAAKATKPLHPFLAARAFKVCYEPGGTEAKYEFDLNDAKWRNIYKPAHGPEDVSLGKKGNCSLQLYKLGEDEWCRSLRGGKYDGILVVAVRISLRFKAGVFHPVPPAWAATTAYAQGACVKQAAKHYACTVPHTSGAAFAAGNWVEIDAAGPNYGWVAGTEYDPKEWTGGHVHACAVTHKAGSRIDAYWLQAGTAKGAWATTTAYAKSDLVTQGGKTYVCAAPHAGGTFATDLGAGKWVEKAADKGAFAAGTDYAVSDSCTDAGKTWVCLAAHKGGSFAADVAAGRWVRPASRPWKAVQGDWAAALNADLQSMVEGRDGKFFLSATGTNAFKKTYVRMFAQWEVKAPAAAATAGTHFTLEVTPDGSTTFAATDAAIQVGDRCDNATIIRYLFGRIDDDATGRAGQNLTDLLRSTDFPKIKDWIDGKAAGTFSVEAIP